MPSLNRPEETVVPSLPSELTNTAVPEGDDWLKMLPMKQLLFTFARRTYTDDVYWLW